MDFLTIKEAMAQGGGTVSVRGWVYRERGSAKVKFVVLRDGTGILQCVIKRDVVGDEAFAVADKLQVEASLELHGEIRVDERAPTGFELQVQSFTVVGESDTFPITKDQSPEFLLDKRHLWLRSRKMQAILKIRATLFKTFREYFDSRGFIEYHSPIFQSTQCEGGSSLFRVKYFDAETFLAQTWQLYAEPAIFSYEKLYTIAPSFRAEKSKTSRHLTEYWHAEMEQAWASFEDIKAHGEGVLKAMVGAVLEKHAEELAVLKRDPKLLKPTIEKPFPRMTYTEALRILKERCGMDVPWGKDLRTVEEDKLSKLYDTPIIIDGYPKAVKAFYMKEFPDDPRVVQGCDFIAPEGYGELIGGSARETSLEKLKERLKADGEKLEDYEYYFDTRRYGSVPHGGFGLGMERVISWVCGLDSIKDAIPFPRTPLRWTP
ncbi:asparagine--tRNA ligase [Candidatus Woesearchaeota archaeon]|nr:MAG: asparagine--tRNA ligase [Candidatus Woesearchaeota archaeon]